MEVVVEGVETNIFGEVCNPLLIVRVSQRVRVVSVENVIFVFLHDSILSGKFGEVNTTLLLNVSDFVYLSLVGEQLRVNFVRSRQDKSFTVIALKNSNIVRVKENSFVKVNSGPGGSLVESLKVFGKEEQFVKSNSLYSEIVIEDGEGEVFGQHTSSVHVEEFFHRFLVLKKITHSK